MMRLGDVLQVVGAVLILSAYLLAQLRRLDTSSYVYLVLNFAGAGVLAGLAATGHQWGFLLLEFVWSLVSAGALTGKLARRITARAHPSTPGRRTSAR
jgi:hypothetical protein